jgi:hypothetical protein
MISLPLFLFCSTDDLFRLVPVLPQAKWFSKRKSTLGAQNRQNSAQWKFFLMILVAGWRVAAAFRAFLVAAAPAG